MVEELSGESIVFLAIFLLVAFWVIRLFIKLNKEMKEKTSLVVQRMDELEREYVSIKPELAELRALLESRVDYPFLEKKLHELVVLVMGKAKKPMR